VERVQIVRQRYFSDLKGNSMMKEELVLGQTVREHVVE
jgi:hypothetical protein